MFAFDYNFLFLDEVELQDKKNHIAKKNIVVKEKQEADISQIFSQRSPWVTMTLRNVRYYSNERFEYMDVNDSWGLEIEDVLTLVWNGKDEIFYIKSKEYTADLLLFWVLHTFFPLVLEISREHRVFHVAGVSLNDKAVLLSALSFGGKSTLVEYFLKQGHKILGDDTVAIKQEGKRYKAIASYPFYRPFREPETLGKPILEALTEPLCLGSIYYLEKVDKNAEVNVCELKGIEKFKAFHYSSFVNFDFLKVEHFEFFSKMAECIPIYKITVPWDVERLDEVYQAIITHNNV